MADLDHRFMKPPFLRITEHRTSETGGRSILWDLRIAQPNVSHMDTATVHSFEHFLGTYLRESSEKVLNVGPMGCQTGFYIVTVDLEDHAEMTKLLVEVLERVGTATEVPLANNVECGWAEHHSLVGAQELAAWLLRLCREW